MKRMLLLALTALVTFSASAFTVADSHEKHVEAKAKKTKEFKEVTFSVHLHCASCVKKVQENLSFEKGVKGLDVCLGHHTVTVKYDPTKTSEEILKSAIEKLGYKVSGVVAPEDVHHHDH